MRQGLLFSLLFLPCYLFSQATSTLIQFSGIIVSSDSLGAIPFASISVEETHNLAYSNYSGFFSLVAAKGDTIRFRATGYKNEQFIIPQDLSDNKYSVIQLMTKDTIYLGETVIYPWPSREDFREAFLTYNIPDDYYERARKNLERETLKEMAEQLPMDANMNADYQTVQIAQRIYYAGQYPPMRIFDVFAWKQFIEAWKRGDFKNDD